MQYNKRIVFHFEEHLSTMKTHTFIVYHLSILAPRLKTTHEKLKSNDTFPKKL